MPASLISVSRSSLSSLIVIPISYFSVLYTFGIRPVTTSVPRHCKEVACCCTCCVIHPEYCTKQISKQNHAVKRNKLGKSPGTMNFLILEIFLTTQGRTDESLLSDYSLWSAYSCILIQDARPTHCSINSNKSNTR